MHFKTWRTDGGFGGSSFFFYSLISVQNIKIRTVIPTPIKYREIESKIEDIFSYENKKYKFASNKHLRELKLSTHCVIKINCQLTKNK